MFRAGWEENTHLQAPSHAVCNAPEVKLTPART
jgi:hypothetical protein